MPRYKALQSYTIGASFNANTQQGAEDTVTKPGEDTITDVLKSDPDKADYGYKTYFRVSSKTLYADFAKVILGHQTGSSGSGFDNPYCMKKGISAPDGAFC